jgi:hypothetical protein
LIFVVHGGLTPPNGDFETHSSMAARVNAMARELTKLGDESSEDNIARSIEKLQGLLRDLEDQGWTIQADFQRYLTDNKAAGVRDVVLLLPAGVWTLLRRPDWETRRGVARRRVWETWDGVGPSVVSDVVGWVAWWTLAKMTG